MFPDKIQYKNENFYLKNDGIYYILKCKNNGKFYQNQIFIKEKELSVQLNKTKYLHYYLNLSELNNLKDYTCSDKLVMVFFNY